MQIDLRETWCTAMSVMEISDNLKRRILSHWDTISDEAVAKVNSIQQIEGRYLNIPFVVDGVPTNMARWDSHKNKFDAIFISVWDDDEVKQAIIKLK